MDELTGVGSPEQMLKERDRLLQRVARVYGLSFAGVSLLCLLIPGAVSLWVLPVAIPLYAVLGVAHYRIALAREPIWVLIIISAGLALIMLIGFDASPTLSQSAFSAISELAAASVPSIAITLTTSARRIAVLVASLLLVSAVTLALTSGYQNVAATAMLLLLGWALPTIVGVWVAASVPRAMRRIASIGRAHHAERQASELEAQRRRSARLLHDTVLATLTLLAHSGVGVDDTALRDQAADDARLLRQLRLGQMPTPQSYGGTELSTAQREPVSETVLGTTLQSVKQRFWRMGLDVNWHGTGQVLLPPHVLDAFLLALAECLENVRRHSGVSEAHVTIVEDETAVRAMITDAGVGFTLSEVDPGRLGFQESIVGRLQEVGGQARLFSTPGSGTTVVLEVPR
ncbi:MAG: histidine kinase [Microbacteriaceae bacterium]